MLLPTLLQRPKSRKLTETRHKLSSATTSTIKPETPIVPQLDKPLPINIQQPHSTLHHLTLIPSNLPTTSHASPTTIPYRLLLIRHDQPLDIRSTKIGDVTQLPHHGNCMDEKVLTTAKI
jgi:hypothetical protein